MRGFLFSVWPLEKPKNGLNVCVKSNIMQLLMITDKMLFNVFHIFLYDFIAFSHLQQ